MRRFSIFLVFAVSMALLVSSSLAQPPNGKKGPGQKGSKKGMPDPAMVDDIVARMMAFDANKDGKLTRDEITDTRLLRLFDRSVNKDGSITKEEMVAVATKMVAELAAEGGGKGGPGKKGKGGFNDFGPFGGKKGKGGFDDFGPKKGKGGPGGFGAKKGQKGGPGAVVGGLAPVGQVLPGFAQVLLKLTDEQKKQLDSLQTDVNTKLDSILNDDQKKLLKDLRGRGPGGPKGYRRLIGLPCDELFGDDGSSAFFGERSEIGLFSRLRAAYFGNRLSLFGR